MQDLIDNLSEAFKARDVFDIERLQDDVIATTDSDMLSLYVSYTALLVYDRYAQDVQAPPSVYTTLNTLLSRLDTAWTAYLALRAQQEPAGE